MIGDIDWQRVFQAAADEAERRLGLEDCLILDQDILAEVEQRARDTVASYGKKDPNTAKVAGHIAFWIRKLKPISFVDGAPKKFLAVNEAVSIIFALAFCDAINVR
jgi:hypothetical protein